jgi:2-oxoisovalerate dehydrogenase E2 component (dihydrolipoyl transacylase)
MAERVFAMPDLGEGLEEGRIVAWHVAEGDAVELNQPIVEVETAKATVEIPSPFAGVVVSLGAGVGDDVPVGVVLVTFSVADGVGGGGVAATPAVRRLARDLRVDLSTLSGSGPRGRVTAEDVRGAHDAGTGGQDGEGQEMKISATRRAIAENLARQAAIPQVTTFRTVDCLELEAFRAKLEVSPLPVVVAALCRTIALHPMLNATWAGDAILVHRVVNVGIATDTERGLVVPVVRDAGTLGIGELGSEIGRLAQAARAVGLTPDDVSGATIGVSNTGSYGSEAGTPLLTPGCSVTLTIGVVGLQPLVVDGAVVARPACTLSVTFDHRVLDGATVGRALADLVDLLRSGERLRDLPR